jgi:hypothetical protein
MSRISSDLNKIGEALAELVFQPTTAQREVKAAFWAIHRENPISDVRKVSLADALQITEDPRLSTWWSEAGFKEWFTDQDEFRKRLELAGDLAIEAIIDTLKDKTAKHGERTKAAELALRIKDKVASDAKEDRYADEAISRMSKEELEVYIKRRQGLIQDDH